MLSSSGLVQDSRTELWLAPVIRPVGLAGGSGVGSGVDEIVTVARPDHWPAFWSPYRARTGTLYSSPSGRLVTVCEVVVGKALPAGSFHFLNFSPDLAQMTR